MVTGEKGEGMLSPYRVLDLTDEKGFLCSKLLGDLGADVIKIERPGGDPARRLGPFYHDKPDAEKSLLWFAFNTSKRGITLDIETADGREIFKKLASTADVVIESFTPGYLDKLGLGYPALEKVNPGIILVSITPFGQTGPYKDYKSPDLIVWAMSGLMNQFDNPDRPPTWVSYHAQAYLQGAVVAAGGAMMALYHRRLIGEGQHVDVSLQECVTTGIAPPPRPAAPDAVTKEGADSQPPGGRAVGRAGGGVFVGPTRIRRIWPCRDGYVVLLWWAGLGARRWNLPLVRWMDSEGIADDWLKGFDWDIFDWMTTSQETADHLEELTLKFFMKHTKAELLEGAVKYQAMVYPVNTAADTLQSIQLSARQFWVEVEHPDLSTTITYPGAFVISTEASPRVKCRAPLIGEHNEDVYEKELGLPRAQLLVLRQAGVI